MLRISELFVHQGPDSYIIANTWKVNWRSVFYAAWRDTVEPFSNRKKMWWLVTNKQTNQNSVHWAFLSENYHVLEWKKVHDKAPLLKPSRSQYIQGLGGR